MYAGQQRKRFWPAFVLAAALYPAALNPATLHPAILQLCTHRPCDSATPQPNNPATQQPRNPTTLQPCDPATQHPASDTLRVRRTVASLSASNAGNPADCDIDAGHRAESCRNLPETVQTLPDPRASSRRGRGEVSHSCENLASSAKNLATPALGFALASLRSRSADAWTRPIPLVRQQRPRTDLPSSSARRGCYKVFPSWKADTARIFFRMRCRMRV